MVHTVLSLDPQTSEPAASAGSMLDEWGSTQEGYYKEIVGCPLATPAQYVSDTGLVENSQMS